MNDKEGQYRFGWLRQNQTKLLMVLRGTFKNGFKNGFTIFVKILPLNLLLWERDTHTTGSSLLLLYLTVTLYGRPSTQLCVSRLKKRESLAWLAGLAVQAVVCCCYILLDGRRAVFVYHWRQQESFYIARFPPPHSLYLRTEVVFYLVKQDFALAEGLYWVAEVLLALYWLVRCARIPHWLQLRTGAFQELYYIQ